MKINLTYKDMGVQFAETDDLDIVLDFTLKFEISYDVEDPNFNHTIVEGLESLVVFYDELRMVAGFDVDMQDDIVFMNLEILALQVHQRYG